MDNKTHSELIMSVTNNVLGLLGDIFMYQMREFVSDYEINTSPLFSRLSHEIFGFIQEPIIEFKDYNIVKLEARLDINRRLGYRQENNYLNSEEFDKETKSILLKELKERFDFSKYELDKLDTYVVNETSQLVIEVHIKTVKISALEDEILNTIKKDLESTPCFDGVDFSMFSLGYIIFLKNIFDLRYPFLSIIVRDMELNPMQANILAKILKRVKSNLKTYGYILKKESLEERISKDGITYHLVKDETTIDSKDIVSQILDVNENT